MKELRLLILIATIWFAGVAFLGGLFIIGLVPTIPGLAALAASAREVRRGQYESVAPWACVALVPLAFVGVVALSQVHLHDFTGGAGSDCNPIFQDCSAHPLQGLAHCLSFACFLVAGINILRLIASASRQVKVGA